MRPGARSAATIFVLCALLLLGGAWAWSALTAPFPGKAAAPLCEDRTVAKGEKIYPPQVVVSVYNAGQRLGLASQTMSLFARRGFKEGGSGNAPKSAKVGAVQVWTSQPRNPAVRLVVSQLRPRHTVVKRKPIGAGVTVLVGDRFTGLGPRTKFVRAHSATQICSPPVG